MVTNMKNTMKEYLNPFLEESDAINSRAIDTPDCYMLVAWQWSRQFPQKQHEEFADVAFRTSIPDVAYNPQSLTITFSLYIRTTIKQ